MGVRDRELSEAAFTRHPIKSEPKLMVPECLPARDVPAECLKPIAAGNWLRAGQSRPESA